MKTDSVMALQSDNHPLLLASASASRAALLKQAGLAFAQRPAEIDERAVRDALDRSGEAVLPEDVAEILARAKAEEVSARAPEEIVIGADQVLALEGRIFEKPGDFDTARDQLLSLRGKTHMLHSAVVIARGGQTIWAHVDAASLTMRDFSAEFLGGYLAAAGSGILSSVGAYHLEGPGVQLFSHIEGDYFTILGLPLLPLLDQLRELKIVTI